MTITLTKDGTIETIEAAACRCSDSGVVSMVRIRDNDHDRPYIFRMLSPAQWREIEITGDDWRIELA